jgi:hypothetical protein
MHLHRRESRYIVRKRVVLLDMLLGEHPGRHVVNAHYMRTARWCNAGVHFWHNIHAEGAGASVQTKFLAAFENLLNLWVSERLEIIFKTRYLISRRK